MVVCASHILNKLNNLGASEHPTFMRRHAHAKREHALSAVILILPRSCFREITIPYLLHLQLDALLFELFVLSYLLDPVIFRMLFRATAQFQFSRPRDLDRSLRFMFIYCCLVNIGPVLRHVLSSFHYETQGLLLDFVGRSTPFITLAHRLFS